MDEFTIIERYFAPLSQITPSAGQVALGIGDDAALVGLAGGEENIDLQWVVATDTLVSGVHFLASADPADIGWKALAVNLSDLAAMGADPAWFTLALTLPDASETWLEHFASGLQQLAKQVGIPLVGGDTTQGPLTITVTVGGVVRRGQALTRSGARPGDQLFVSGELGWAALGLAVEQGSPPILPGLDVERARQALLRPQPQLALGKALRGVASACIDLSDGLLVDLWHLVRRSQQAAQLDLQAVPVPECVRAETAGGLPECVGFGDDYQLLFSVPPDHVSAVMDIAQKLNLRLTRIGEIRLPDESDSARILDMNFDAVALTGYRHFDDKRT